MKKIQCILLERKDLTFEGQAKAHDGKVNLLTLADLAISPKSIKFSPLVMFENYIVKEVSEYLGL